MKKLIVCLVFASTFMVQANENTNTEKVSVNKENGSCTVTVTMTDSNGDVFTGTGTAETCSAARKNAYASLARLVSETAE
ncbi:hypothetical protein [Flavobacterium sp.]|uniref:hypothetical protein n=1 Tax=Flavobacterium sp. TaxID=239 RepID=UPI0040484059